MTRVAKSGHFRLQQFFEVGGMRIVTRCALTGGDRRMLISVPESCLLVAAVAEDGDFGLKGKLSFIVCMGGYVACGTSLP
jgi:hypothetical protein